MSTDMAPPRRDDYLRGSVVVELNGVTYRREFALESDVAKLYDQTLDPKDWPISNTGVRMLKGGMRDEVGYQVQKTAEECLRHVLYTLTGRF